MARPPEFDPSAALDDAMEAFWKFGFSATSTSVLESHMQISRSSLYATFGSKQDLYALAMDRYIDDLRHRVSRQLAAPGPAVETLKRFFRRLPRRGRRSGEPLRCCMLVRAAVSGENQPQRTRSQISRGLNALDVLFESILERAVNEGGLKSGSSIPDLARYLTTTYQAINVAAHAGRSQRALNDIVQQSLTVLE